MSMSTSSDMPALFGEEYQALRESVSALAQKKILPFAHDVDENSRYPQEVADACKAQVLLLRMCQLNLVDKVRMR